MKFASLCIFLAATWLPAVCAARHRMHGAVPPVEFGSMAANLQNAATQSFLRHRISTQDKELKLEKDVVKKDELQIADLESRLNDEEHRTSALTTQVSDLQGQEVVTISKLEARVNALEQNTLHARTEQVANSETQTRIPTVVHPKTKPTSKKSAKVSKTPVDVASTQPTTLDRKGDVHLINTEGLDADHVMDMIKDAVADVRQPEGTVSTASAGQSLPSTWCPPPCDQHNDTISPEVAAKIDPIHAAMAVVSGSDTDKDVENSIPQARQIIMQSAADRAHKLFSSQPAPATNEISDQIESPQASASYQVSNEHAAMASLADVLKAARQADNMLNKAQVDAEVLEKQLDKKSNMASAASSSGDSQDTQEQNAESSDVPQILVVPIDAADEMMTPSNATDKEDSSNGPQEGSAAQQMENMTENALANAVANAVAEVGKNNNSVVVLHLHLEGPGSQEVPVEDEATADSKEVPAEGDAAADSKNTEPLAVKNFIKKMDSDTVKAVDTAQKTHEKVARDLQQVVDELKTMPEDTRAADAKLAPEQENSDNFSQATAPVVNFDAPEQQKPSQVSQVEADAKESMGDTKPNAEELKMAREAVAYAESEPQQEHQEDAKMSKQELKDAVEYTHQERESDANADHVQDSSEDNQSDMEENQDEQELNKLSQEGLVVDDDSDGQPTAKDVAEVNKVSLDNQVPRSTDEQRAEYAPLDAGIQASAKSLVAAVAKEDDIAKEAQAAQKEDEQVDKEALDRMSKAGVQAANELEAELSKMNH